MKVKTRRENRIGLDREEIRTLAEHFQSELYDEQKNTTSRCESEDLGNKALVKSDRSLFSQNYDQSMHVGSVNKDFNFNRRESEFTRGMSSCTLERLLEPSSRLGFVT